MKAKSNGMEGEDEAQLVYFAVRYPVYLVVNVPGKGLHALYPRVGRQKKDPPQPKGILQRIIAFLLPPPHCQDLCGHELWRWHLTCWTCPIRRANEGKTPRLVPLSQMYVIGLRHMPPWRSKIEDPAHLGRAIESDGRLNEK